jgi:outer membrane murein-binding lipoprotein Lpp
VRAAQASDGGSATVLEPRQLVCGSVVSAVQDGRTKRMAGGVDREVFDIAEAAGRVEELKTEIISVEEQLKQLAREAGAAAGDADREKIEKHKGVLERKLQRLKEAVSVAEQSLVREEG